MAFIGEAHPIACSIPNMHMRSAPQGPWREWRRKVRRTKVHCNRRGGGIARSHDHPLAMKWRVLPIRRRMLRSQNEHDLVLARMKRSDAPMRAILWAIQLPHLASPDVDHFNRIAVEAIPGCIAAGI